MPDDRLAFPKGFFWGSATSSHQVEGGNENSDWWAWEQIPGRIADGTRAGLACDWWHRAESDLRVAAQMGHNSHRLSLEWSRLEPQKGVWDEAAAMRYREILSAMHALGITPMVTLYHFTLPLWLCELGGWENAKAADYFKHFVERAVDAFGDLCELWCTINEPMIYVTYGYLYGIWPPGFGGFGPARLALRHLAQAHAKAYEAIHARQARAMVGYAKHIHLFDPKDPARWRDRALAKLIDRFFNESVLTAFDEGTFLLPFGWGRRAKDGSKQLDFLGLNYYSRSKVTFNVKRKKEFFIERSVDPDAPFSMEGWGEVYAEGLYRALKRLDAYGLPIYVTEFGVADNDDSLRPRFIIEHVAAMHRAIAEGVALRGAYFWSLVDNFEWAEGWRARFGLIGMDRETQKRHLKGSAEVYRRIAVANGVERALVKQVTPDQEATLFDGIGGYDGRGAR